MKSQKFFLLIAFLIFPFLIIYSQTYMNVKYTDGSNKYKEIDLLKKITFNTSGSQINYVLETGEIITENWNQFKRITFSNSNTGTPLPVEVMSFSASVKEDSVILIWTTATEVNNYGFEIERTLLNPPFNQRSETGGFEKIGFVGGAGNSNSPKDYFFADVNPPAGKLEYRLKQIDLNGSSIYYPQSAEVNYGITGIAEKQLPKEYALEQNFPNPFNPTTNIGFRISDFGFVTLKVYDVLGNEVITLVNEPKKPGYYNVLLNGNKLSTGVYLYRLTTGKFTAVKKLILMK